MNIQRVGKIGEDIAVNYFKNNNYHVLARNIRFRFGEIDIMLEKNGVLIFVEVKTRRSNKYGAPFESVSSEKIRKMHLVVRKILGKMIEKPWQFDVVSIELTPQLRLKKLQHFKNILA